MVLTSADEGGSWYYRVHLVTQALARAGHVCRESQRAIPSWVAEAEVIVGQRVCKEGPSQLWQQWAAEGRRLVYDVDDDLSAVDPSSAEAFGFYSQPEVQERITQNMSVAARVTCASEGIAQWASRHNPNVVVVPNGLPASLLSWPRREWLPGAPVVVGWVGSQQSLPELKLAAPALRRLLERAAPDSVVLHTIGAPRAALARFGLDRADVRVTEWTPPGDAYLSSVDFDVWVAPYRETGFNEAKFPTKVLEAAFLGIPLVASNIAPYRSSVRHGVTGFVVRREHEWGGFVRRLVEDDGLRKDMSAAAFASAAGRVVEGLVPSWERALWE